MKRILLVTALLVMVVVSVASAADAAKKGGMEYWLGAGYSKMLESGSPSGSLGALVGLNYMMSPSMAIGVMSGYLITGKTDSSATSLKTTSSMIPITGQLTYFIPGKGFTPYLGAGAGAYMGRTKVTMAGSDTTTSDTQMGFNLGAGFKVPAGSSMAVGADVKVHFVRGDKLNDDGTVGKKFYKFLSAVLAVNFK
ncbi:MAG: outer membrane beta-barrel protein [Candidatus Eisenbacteria bacterium]|nr:outer membrane beta-barrel protein [Candidatus Eisenbacteria bacterium]